MSGTTQIQVPCGKCMACRVNRSSDWSNRLLHELSYHRYASFVTLTYDDEHLPMSDTYIRRPTLRKRDVVLWIKRIREHVGQIKYYLAGEYGPRTLRPHYHAIIFGINPTVANHLLKYWGMCNEDAYVAGTVTAESIRYVASYICKKYHGEAASYYTERSIEPPFAIMSKGIGRQWAIDNAYQLKDNLCINRNGKPNRIPRYYRKILHITANDLAQVVDKEDLHDKSGHVRSIQRDRNLAAKTALKEGKL